jgi:hypothetical protein
MFAYGEEAHVSARHNRACVGAAFWARYAYEQQVTRWEASEPAAARAAPESAPCAEGEDVLVVLDWLELDLKKPPPLAVAAEP